MLLRDLREQKNLTKEELAEIIGTTPENIALWESTDPKPIPSEYLLKLADFYQCPYTHLQKLQQNALGSTQKTKAQFKPINCPHCKSKNLAFVTEYHKALGLRGFESFLQLILWGIIFIGIATYILPSLPDFQFDFEGLPPLVIFIVLIYIGKKILQHYIVVAESKTHIQAICKDCGHFWLHDDPFSS